MAKTGPKMQGEKHVTLKTYINRKIRILKDEFCLRLTDQEIEYFHTLKTEGEVNAYAHKLLRNKL